MLWNVNARNLKKGMLEKAVADFNINLSESIVVGDKEIDVQTGKNDGIKHSIQVRSGHAIDEANSVADEVHEDLIRFAQALAQEVFPSK